MAFCPEALFSQLNHVIRINWVTRLRPQRVWRDHRIDQCLHSSDLSQTWPWGQTGQYCYWINTVMETTCDLCLEKFKVSDGELLPKVSYSQAPQKCLKTWSPPTLSRYVFLGEKSSPGHAAWFRQGVPPCIFPRHAAHHRHEPDP